jgi:hypothetical protein
MFFIPISRWAIAPVFQLLDVRREPGLSPVGYQFVSLGKQKRDAAQFASIEFSHWLAIALNRRRHERFQRIDNNGQRCMSATMIEVARFKTPSWPLVC